MIEVALSLAVIGIAMVGILGLLAIGLNAARDATDDNVAAQIVQAMVADRQSMPFSSRSMGPTLTATAFYIPSLDSTVTPNLISEYTLYFLKSGGVPSNIKIAKSYFEVNIKERTSLASDFSDLAILDFQVSWPANATDIANRMTYFYTTAIGKK